MSESQPTTTHAEPGDGNPTLVISMAGHGEAQIAPRTFALTQDEVSVGSGTDQDIQLEGLDAHHLTIFHDERDEYRVRAVGPIGGGSASEPAERALRTGSHLSVGSWELTFHREEFADHGRPFGGRQGGEFADNKLQPPRPADQGEAGENEPVAGMEQRDDPRPPPERAQ